MVELICFFEGSMGSKVLSRITEDFLRLLLIQQHDGIQ